MSDLYSTVVGANARKVPSTDRLGSVGIRELAFFSVTLTNVHVNFADANSLFARAVLAAGGVSELFFVGTPASNAFVVAVALDTADKEGNPLTEATALKQAIDAFTGGTATVAALTASGASIAA
jgi:hypothetical protein